MPRILSTVVAGLILLTGTIGLSADVLKAKGLKKSGTTYVVPGEAEVQKKLNAARLLARQMSNAAIQQQAYAQQAVENKQMIQELTQQRIMLNQQLAQQLPPAQHNQLVAVVNTVTDRLNLLHRHEAEPVDRRQVDTQASHHREAYVQAIIDLRVLVDATAKQYEELAADPEVTSALTTAKATLGPSKTFLANVKLLERAESMVLTETVDLKKQGGIFWLDVTFNGKVTKQMAFDTGAADVVLPADFAASIGLRPGPNDPTIRCQVADGSIVEAKQMTVPSMRVGKFTIKDVSCTVMPADKKDVPPLLGQTFQRNFMLKFSPDSGKLVLSRIESPDAPATSAKTKATTKKRAVKPDPKAKAEDAG
jgi:clan AA aspartic protease (TIGR02281 family)